MNRYKEAYDNATPEQRAEVDFLENMRAFYPGDPDHGILQDMCEILGVPFEAPEITVTYG